MTKISNQSNQVSGTSFQAGFAEEYPQVQVKNLALDNSTDVFEIISRFEMASSNFRSASTSQIALNMLPDVLEEMNQFFKDVMRLQVSDRIEYQLPAQESVFDSKK
jgi:hypothetical protein